MKGNDYNYFLDLLKDPAVNDSIPTGFNVEEEARHLCELWDNVSSLQEYDIESFISVGGSGMVFKVINKTSKEDMALKLARKKIFDSEDASPVSKEELSTLKKLSHTNIVRLYDAFEEPKKGCIGFCMTYVENPQGLDRYLKQVLTQEPKNKNYMQYSFERLEKACQHLITWITEIADVLKHMHEQGIYHFDIKPANILISFKEKRAKAMLTDMGSCVHKSDIGKKTSFRVRFTWTYGHTDLKNIQHKPGSISGGAVRVSSEVRDMKNLSKYDLYALGKTIQEALAIIQNEFGERCFTSYTFRFIHLIACMLLDGMNTPGDTSQITPIDGIRFVDDVSLGYSVRVFKVHKINSSNELLMRIKRIQTNYSIAELANEFDLSQARQMNIVFGNHMPITPRVSAILEHPAIRRLKGEKQVGWIREIYPGATHDRWVHTAGVLSAVIEYCKNLLSDTEIPTFLVFVEQSDIEHILLAALLHDIGQTSSGHDLEEAAPAKMFSHVKYIERILDDDFWGDTTLRNVINKYWPNVDLERLMRIIKGDRASQDNIPLDGIAMDIVNGYMDADKFDYIQRDSIFCNVAYGKGVEANRFVQMLTVCQSKNYNNMLQLAFKAKGRAAIESLLLARYQMYNAVYWHHTYRCIKSMFITAIHLTFDYILNEISNISTRKKTNEKKSFSLEHLDDLFYYNIICGKSWKKSFADLGSMTKPSFLNVQPLDREFENERTLEFVYRFSHKGAMQLLEMIRDRKLYKRIYEVRTGTIKTKYSEILSQTKEENRIKIASGIQINFFLKIEQMKNEKVTRGNSQTEEFFSDELEKLKKANYPLVIIDYPEHGVPKENLNHWK